MDDSADLISYEEYYSFGESSYRAGRSKAEVVLKRYRYSGMERDESSGFSYHFSRFYATWIGRWINTDPIGIEGGLNLFAYCNSNPISFKDINGTTGENVQDFPKNPEQGQIFERKKGNAAWLYQYDSELGWQGLGGSVSLDTVEVKPQSWLSKFWEHGGDKIAAGLLIAGAAILTLATGGLAAPLLIGAAFALAGGIGLTVTGTFQYADYELNEGKNEKALNELGQIYESTSSAAGTVALSTSLIATEGDWEKSHEIAGYAGLAESALSLGSGVKNLVNAERTFSKLNSGNKLFSYKGNPQMIKNIRLSLGGNQSAKIGSSNPIFARGTELMENSHFIPEAWYKGNPNLERIFNRPWNFKLVTSTEHALHDPMRYRFMKSAFKSLYPVESQFRGLFKIANRSPIWLRNTGFGIGTGMGRYIEQQPIKHWRDKPR